MTQPTGYGPQDAPAGQPWPAWPQEPFPASAPDPSGQRPDAAPVAGDGPPRQPAGTVGQVTPPGAGDPERGSPGGSSAVPTGPNWALAVVGLLLVLAAGAQLAYLLGFRLDADVRFGPQVLIVLGAALLLVGAGGSLARRRVSASRRRRRATRCR